MCLARLVSSLPSSSFLNNNPALALLSLMSFFLLRLLLNFLLLLLVVPLARSLETRPLLVWEMPRAVLFTPHSIPAARYAQPSTSS